MVHRFKRHLKLRESFSETKYFHDAAAAPEEGCEVATFICSFLLSHVLFITQLSRRGFSLSTTAEDHLCSSLLCFLFRAIREGMNNEHERKDKEAFNKRGLEQKGWCVCGGG